MGRPKTHDHRQAAALLDAAEELVSSGGLAALSVRAVAERSATTTRAVYSLFGSKAGLVAALGARTFDLLGGGVEALPRLIGPRRLGRRRRRASFVSSRSLGRPSSRSAYSKRRWTSPSPANSGRWHGRPSRSSSRGSIACRWTGNYPTETQRSRDAVPRALRRARHSRTAWHVPSGDAERLWREALAALLDGLAQSPPRRPARRRGLG